MKPCRSRLVKKRELFDEAGADGLSRLVKKRELFGEAVLDGIIKAPCGTEL